MARWHYNYAPVYDQLEITLMFCCYSIFPPLRWHLFTWSLKATSCSNADNWLSWYESKDRCFVKSVLCDYWNRKALCSTVIWLLMNKTTNSSSVIFFQALPSSCCCLQVFFLKSLTRKNVLRYSIHQLSLIKDSICKMHLKVPHTVWPHTKHRRWTITYIAC